MLRKILFLKKIYHSKPALLIRAILADLKNVQRMICFGAYKNSRRKDFKKDSIEYEILNRGLFIHSDKISDDTCEKIKEVAASAILNANGNNITLDCGSYIEHRKSTYAKGERYDQGVVHIHDMDKLCPKVKSLIPEVLLKSLGNIYREDFQIFSYSLYRNNEVSNTRVFHQDGLSFPLYKVFIYLNDVKSREDGPYTYILESHRLVAQKMKVVLKNFFKRRHIRELHDGKDYKGEIKHFFGSKGSVAISDQHGYHRGWPQGPNSSRYVLVYYLAKKSDAENAILVK